MSDTWRLGTPPTAGDRRRLLEAGVLTDVLDGLDLRRVEDPVPSWWHRQGNRLFVHGEVTVPRPLVDALALYPFSDVLVVVASTLENMASCHVGGDRATVFLGPDSSFTATDVYCGADSVIVLNARVTATRCAVVDARNGGSVVTAPDQLWAADVYVATDDMHRLEDRDTGARINPYGAHIRIGEHVWLGRDAVVTGHVEIGDGAVVGARSLVRGQKVPAHTAVAGTPARVIRANVSWSEGDRP